MEPGGGTLSPLQRSCQQTVGNRDPLNNTLGPMFWLPCDHLPPSTCPGLSSVTFPRSRQPVYRHLEFPGTFRTRDSGCVQVGIKVFSKRSRSSRSISADVNTCQRNKACGHALALQALGLLQKATGKSHVITVESTYATILSPGMYTLSPCPAVLSQRSRKL